MIESTTISTNEDINNYLSRHRSTNQSCAKYSKYSYSSTILDALVLILEEFSTRTRVLFQNVNEYSYMKRI